MSLCKAGLRGAMALAACAALAVAEAPQAHASVIVSTPTLPLLDFPYTTAGGGMCFNAAGICVGGASLDLTSVISNTIVGNNEFIVTDVTYSAKLENLSHTPIGTVLLTGTVEQEVFGRMNLFDQGSWTDQLLSLSVSGTVDGATLTIVLDPSHTSSGTSSIAQSGHSFIASSFFDVFVDITLDTPTPLHTSVGPIVATATSVPEPVSLALLAGPLVALTAVRRRQS
jgi:hypothetical protein